jgi:ATP-binding cassette subfamily B protein
VILRNRLSRVAQPQLRLRSSVPGRERWEVPAVAGKPVLARQLEEVLSREPRVREIRANPISGRVLITYSPVSEKLSIGVLIRDALSEVARHPDRLAPSPRLSASLWRILETSLPERKYLAGALFFSVLSFAVHFAEGLFVVSTIRNRARFSAGGGQIEEAGAAARQPLSLTGIAAISLLWNSVDAWAQYQRLRRWQQLGQTTQQRLRARLVAFIEEQDLAFFDKYPTGRLMHLVLQDTARIGEFVERGCEMALDRLLTAAVCGLLLVSASPLLAGITCLPLILIMLSGPHFGRRAATNYARRDEMLGRLSQMLENSFAGIVDVKSFTAEHQELRRLRECDREASDAALRASTLWAMQTGIGRGLYSVGMSLTSAYGGDLLSQGRLTQQQYVRVVYMFPRLLDAIDGMAQVVRLYRDARSAADLLMQVMEARPTIRSGPLRLTHGACRGEIVFDNVSFGYNPSNRVIENVSFELRPGETLGIAGRTGSGKSTLLRLMMRFYDVDDGRILLDGEDIRQLNLRDLRSSVGLVSQDVYLFDGTVRDNVLYGQPDASDEEVTEALREAGGEELLESLPGGLQAEVGERGRRLSGGERQRIAIARALLKRPPVLALDEATSQLDYETEATVQRSLRRVNADRSLITVAHRLSTIRDSDKIVVLEKGRIQEVGRHDDLLKMRGIYSALWHLQIGEAARAAE